MNVLVNDDRKHLRHAVLAENIVVSDIDGIFDIEFDFLCLNCGKRHWARELACTGLISTVGFQLSCGWVGIRFPWAATPSRDAKSIYGQEVA